MNRSQAASQIFHLFLIKPSHYDDDGYVIQWARSSIPANTLAALYGLARDCSERKVLGEDVEIRITVWDETNTRIRPARIIEQIRKAGGHGLGDAQRLFAEPPAQDVDLSRDGTNATHTTASCVAFVSR